MNSLPLDIENIIIDYKNQMEHREKFKNSLNIIKKIQYNITTEGDSFRTYERTSVQYYNFMNKLEEHCYFHHDINELWIHNVTIEVYGHGFDMDEREYIQTIYESVDYIEIEEPYLSEANNELEEEYIINNF